MKIQRTAKYIFGLFTTFFYIGTYSIYVIRNKKQIIISIDLYLYPKMFVKK